jgi:SprB repeat
VITLRTATGDKVIAGMTLRTPTGDKVIAKATLRTPSGDKVIFDTAVAGTLTVDVSPVSAVGAVAIDETVFVTTNAITATASGGTAPYTYAWTRVSGDSGFNALSGSSATSRFRATVAPGDALDAVFRVTATDARGRTGTADVPASASNFSI